MYHEFLPFILHEVRGGVTEKLPMVLSEMVATAATEV